VDKLYKTVFSTKVLNLLRNMVKLEKLKIFFFSLKRREVILGLNKKITLYGFNNLTKSLSFNIYDLCYAETEKDKKDYIRYIDEKYNSDRLTDILCKVVEIIGANILNISKQDYEPQGASVNILIAEEQLLPGQIDESCNQGILKNRLVPSETIHAHLDKSHITIHTYPEYHPDSAIATFRVDIDVSTCGMISPLNSLNYLIDCFDSDIVTIDYRVRGFTRDVHGEKYYIDHDITSIQDYIDDNILKKYNAVDMNVYQNNTFHTKMLIKDIELKNYLLNQDVNELPSDKRHVIKNSLQKEMVEIFSGMNIY